jgi:ABC transport permease subunit
VRALQEPRGGLSFLGRISVAFAHAWARLRLRPISIARHVYDTGVTAVPIVSLIAFLISVILAYMGAQQLRKFGADIFVVDLVTVGVLRELGVLLTAIIVAGRSGSAFAAEIGAMQLNEEVDALHAIGVDPIEVLVLPRLVGLVIALPLLTLVADLIGLVGGGLLCHALLGHAAGAVPEPRPERHRQHHLLGRHHQGAGIRLPDRDLRLLLRHARARLLARAGPLTTLGGGAIDLLRDPGRRAVCGAVHGARHLMRALLEVQGVVNRFGAQVVHAASTCRCTRARCSASSAVRAPASRCCCVPSWGCAGPMPAACVLRPRGRQHERRRAACT